MSDYDDREQAAYERTVQLFRAVSPDIAVSDGTWTSRDVLAHLVNVARRYTSMPRLADTPRGVDAINAEELAELADTSVEELLGHYGDAFARYREVWVAMGPEHEWPFHGGGRMPTARLRTNWLGEMLLHGYDVAAAAGVDWPVDDADASDLLAFLREIVPVYGRSGEPVSVTWAPDGALPWTLAVTPDGARAEDAGGPSDAVVGGSAWTTVLVLYQRLTPAEGLSRDMTVTGDLAAVERAMACVEKP